MKKMMRKRKIKNFILKTTLFVDFYIFGISATKIEETGSFSWFLVCIACMAYLAVFAYANGWHLERRYEDVY